MKYLILALALLSASCTADLPTGPPTATNVVCPTGCVLPAGCTAFPSPPDHPRGYQVVCTH